MSGALGFLEVIAAAAFVFGNVVIWHWTGAIEVRVIIGGIYFVVGTVGLAAATLIRWLSQHR